MDIYNIVAALPKAWSAGCIKGLRTRGGFVVDIEWADGVLRRARLVSVVDKTAAVCYRGKTIRIRMKAGDICELNDRMKHR